MCVCPRSVVVLVVVLALLDAVAVLLLLVLLLRVGDVPLWVVVRHGLGLVDLQLEDDRIYTFLERCLLISQGAFASVARVHLVPTDGETLTNIDAFWLVV